ncbi:MAG: hypothetical protein ACRDOX_04995, partial [Nocardioides sp.]
GFIGKYVNRFEPHYNDGKLTTPLPPGWTDFETIFGGGYNGWGFASSYLDDEGRMQIRSHPAPERSLPEEELDRHYSGQVASNKAVDFIQRHEREDAPYFLEVATYAPHAQLKQMYPDNPVFPPAFKDRAPAGDPTGGNCGTSECGDLTLDDLVGYNDPRGDNAPTYLREDGSTEPPLPGAPTPSR